MTDRVGYASHAVPVEEVSAQNLLRAMGRFIGQIDVVHLSVNCAGGRQLVAVGLYHQLRAMPFRLVTHNIGVVGSAAWPLFLAGSTRVAVPGSTFFIHPSYVDIPTPTERTRLTALGLREHLAKVDACDASTIDLLLEHGKFADRDEVDRLVFRGEIRYGPEWAWEHGLIDRIAELELAVTPDVRELAAQ
jgi:ATP-dependent protease ClpP protease subunit